jgi:hypothetical protein
VTGGGLARADEILRVLDDCGRSFFFPALDNGYVYLAAGRLSLHRSDADWGLAIEVFGYSPRATHPSTAVYAFSSLIQRSRRAENFVSAEAYATYTTVHPYDELTFVYPIANEDWFDPDDWELVAERADALDVRGACVPVPTAEDCARLDIALEDPPRVRVFEACRALAATHRDALLATSAERRACFPPELREILVLDEWNHPDLIRSQLPSESETFRQLAEVLASGELRRYAPPPRPNTHWRHWPEGGSL